MNPINPEIQLDSHLVIFAKDQSPYRQLPASVDNQGTVVTEWIISTEELADLINGGRLRLSLLYTTTHLPPSHPNYRPLTPIKLEVVKS